MKKITIYTGPVETSISVKSKLFLDNNLFAASQKLHIGPE